MISLWIFVYSFRKQIAWLTQKNRITCGWQPNGHSDAAQVTGFGAEFVVNGTACSMSSGIEFFLYLQRSMFPRRQR